MGFPHRRDFKGENDKAEDDYKTNFKLLGDYIGDHNFIGWRVDSDHNITRLDGVFSGNLLRDAWPLFGLHFLLKGSADR